MDDNELVRAAVEGDTDALDQLLRRHYDRIYAVCRRLAGNDADAQDATQEALITLARRLDRYDGRAKFSTWAYRVATNACLDELRRRGRRPTPGLPEHERADEHPVAQPNTPRPVGDTVSDRLDIDHALGQIQEEYRAPVVLRDLLGMDYAEIADTLGLKPGTVRSRISRGRAALAAVLGNQNPLDERPIPDHG
ncbi:MAG: RNA polymerase sigma factor [Acidimicrobiales bacterium]|nr:RNA polymerase sigma factor [Acidimicrobiales bacterium]